MMRGKTHLVRGTKNRLLSEGSLCNYSHRTCMLNRLEGYEYCLKHILEDKSAPFKQCSFVSSRKAKRCPNAASKIDRKDSYCQEHAKKAAILRVKSGMKKRPKETSESLLEELAVSNNPGASLDSTPPGKRARLPSDSIISKVLDYATSSDSEVETPQVDQSWRGDGDSDAESIDSEQEDVLKHAGVYTAEEVALILRDKLIRLQSLYIDQFKRLQHIMKEKRRKYLHTYKHDREMFGSIKSYKKDPTQSYKYEKLKALKKYHNRCGKEALLHRQSKERRIAVSEGPNYKPPSFPKCCYVKEDSIKCGCRTIPLSKFCAKHILHDPRQVFFHPCSFADGNCGRPVPGYIDPPFCSLHVPLYDPELRIHNLGNVCADTELLEDIKQEPDLFGRDAEVKEENESADVDVGSPTAPNMFMGDDLMSGTLASATEAPLISESVSSVARATALTSGAISAGGLVTSAAVSLKSGATSLATTGTAALTSQSTLTDGSMSLTSGSALTTGAILTGGSVTSAATSLKSAATSLATTGAAALTGGSVSLTAGAILTTGSSLTTGAITAIGSILTAGAISTGGSTLTAGAISTGGSTLTAGSTALTSGASSLTIGSRALTSGTMSLTTGSAVVTTGSSAGSTLSTTRSSSVSGSASVTTESTSSVPTVLSSATAVSSSGSGPSKEQSSSIGLESASLKHSASSGMMVSETKSTGTEAAATLMSSGLLASASVASVSDTRTTPGPGSITASGTTVPAAQKTAVFERVSSSGGSAISSAECPPTSRKSSSSMEGIVASAAPDGNSEGLGSGRSSGQTSAGASLSTEAAVSTGASVSIGTFVASGMSTSVGASVAGVEGPGMSDSRSEVHGSSSEGFLPNGDDPKESGKPEEAVHKSSEEPMDTDT